MAMIATPLGVVLGIVDTLITLHTDPVGKGHESTSVILVDGGLSFAFALCVFATAWYRRRSLTAFALLFLGYSLGLVGVGIPFLFLGGYLLFRAWRVQKVLTSRGVNPRSKTPARPAAERGSTRSQARSSSKPGSKPKGPRRQQERKLSTRTEQAVHTAEARPEATDRHEGRASGSTGEVFLVRARHPILIRRLLVEPICPREPAFWGSLIADDEGSAQERKDLGSPAYQRSRSRLLPEGSQHLDLGDHPDNRSSRSRAAGASARACACGRPTSPPRGTTTPAGRAGREPPPAGWPPAGRDDPPRGAGRAAPGGGPPVGTPSGRQPPPSPTRSRPGPGIVRALLVSSAGRAVDYGLEQDFFGREPVEDRLLAHSRGRLPGHRGKSPRSRVKRRTPERRRGCAPMCSDSVHLPNGRRICLPYGRQTWCPAKSLHLVSIADALDGTPDLRHGGDGLSRHGSGRAPAQIGARVPGCGPRSARPEGRAPPSAPSARSFATTASTACVPSSVTAFEQLVASRLTAVAGDVSSEGLGLDEDGTDGPRCRRRRRPLGRGRRVRRPARHRCRGEPPRAFPGGGGHL